MANLYCQLLAAVHMKPFKTIDFMFIERFSQIKKTNWTITCNNLYSLEYQFIMQINTASYITLQKTHQMG